MKTKYWHEKCFQYALITSFGTSQKFITDENLILQKKQVHLFINITISSQGYERLEVCFAYLL